MKDMLFLPFYLTRYELMKDDKDTKTPDMFKKTNAEIQREYRQRQKEMGGKRLDMRLDERTADQLEYLSSFHNMTKKDVIAFALDKMYQAMNRKIDRERGHNEVYWQDNMTAETRQERKEQDNLELLESLEL